MKQLLLHQNNPHILYNESLGLTTRTGATLFLYGELTGNTAPMLGGRHGPIKRLQHCIILSLRKAVIECIGKHRLSNDGSWTTHGNAKSWSIHDHATEQLALRLVRPSEHDGRKEGSNRSFPEMGKVETNETYYGSGGVSTGPATVYVKCTGHNADCEKGEAVSEDGSNELSWKVRTS